MHILSNYLNFSWEIYYPSEGDYGDPQPDGTENGIVGEARKYNVLYLK